MRNTVNLTLSDALSQNIASLTGRMRTMIQQGADALGLGVEILGFTVGGMHPPVAVARDYQAVVSAELQKVTAVVNARVYRAQILPAAEGSALVDTNAARAEAAEAFGKAAGEAWAFRTLESQYRSSPRLYFFRRRLETLEKGLADRSFTILDSRFQRDGGEVWVTP
jgi:regulator of protease activity HflC (stomatin/prohibitin superfamily)